VCAVKHRRCTHVRVDTAVKPCAEIGEATGTRCGVWGCAVVVHARVVVYCTVIHSSVCSGRVCTPTHPAAHQARRRCCTHAHSSSRALLYSSWSTTMGCDIMPPFSPPCLFFGMHSISFTVQLSVKGDALLQDVCAVCSENRRHAVAIVGKAGVWCRVVPCRVRAVWCHGCVLTF
jgi:hypothetical protein